MEREDTDEAAESLVVNRSIVSEGKCIARREWDLLLLLLLCLLFILLAGEGSAKVPRRLISSRSLCVSSSMLLFEICTIQFSLFVAKQISRQSSTSSYQLLEL